MTATEGWLPVGPTAERLDTTKLDQTDGTDVHREAVVITGPETLAARAAVVAMHDEYALRVTDMPPLASVIDGFGEHTITGIANNIDIWGGPTDTQPEPDTGGYAPFVISDSVEDDPDKGGSVPGTGAHEVHIHYLDTAGAEQSVTVATNGTAEVDSGITDCMFVQEHHATVIGTNLVSVGNVDILAGTGGAVVSRVSAAGNQSMSTMRQVPAGKTLVVTGWHGYAVVGTTKIVNLRIRSSAHDGVLNAGVYHFHDSARLKDSSSGHIPLIFPCPSLATVKVSGWSSGTIDVTARWAGFLINN